MEKIKVRIRAESRVFYNQIRNIDKEEWFAFQTAVELGDHREADKLAQRIADTYLDYSDEADYDAIDGGDVEIDEIKSEA